MERESETEMKSDEKSSPMSVQQFGSLRQYQQKASKLLYVITQHPYVLTGNDAGEMVVFDKADPGTDSITCLKVFLGAPEIHISLALKSSSQHLMQLESAQTNLVVKHCTRNIHHLFRVDLPDISWLH